MAETIVNQFPSFSKALRKSGLSIPKFQDFGFALGLVMILIILILPMPQWLLDIFLAISITFSVMVLMTVLFIEKSTDFNSFPTVLLVSTMLRLSLNLAATRLILANGHSGPHAAGEVIYAFGMFVMGGNFVIGIIVFSILVLVNFVVITKGSGRIAEVSARFTLDSMPGKQMAIDADLSAGLINETEAKQRRKDLELETNFFGSMDGAAKFVRGDAIAALIITIINIIAGIVIGVVQRKISLADAASSYTLLTVGDGLVSQIPALIVSTAAGMLVSKSSADGSTDKALFGQLSAYPYALGMSSVLLIFLALLPGIPKIPFLLLSCATGYMAYRLSAGKTAIKHRVDEKPKEEESIPQMMQVETIRLELGYGLLSLVNKDTGGRLPDQIKALRRQFAMDMGFPIPSVRIQDNMQLSSLTYVIRVKEVEVGRGEIEPNMLLVMNPTGEPIELEGKPTKEPTFGLPAYWVEQSLKSQAEIKGYTVVDAATVLTTHMSEIIKDNLSDLITYSDTYVLLDELAPGVKKLLSDIVPSQVSTSGIQKILQGLLAERVSIRDLPTILEGVSEACAHTRSLTAISEHVRTKLSRQICASLAGSDGTLQMLTLSPKWEQSFEESLVGEGDAKQLAMPPTELQEFVSRLKQEYEKHVVLGDIPVLVTTAQLRSIIRSIVERIKPELPVLSQNEIHPRVKLRTIGTI